MNLTPIPTPRQYGRQEPERRASPGLSALQPPMPGASNHVGLSLSPKGYLERSIALRAHYAPLSPLAGRGLQKGHREVSKNSFKFRFGPVEKWDPLF